MLCKQSPNHSDSACGAATADAAAGWLLTAGASCIHGLQVRKMGDRILSQIIPILREGMASPAATTRQVSSAVRGWRAVGVLLVCYGACASR